MLVKQKYTGNQVVKAGRAFRDFDGLLKDDAMFDTNMEVLSYWRASHENPLDRALEALEQVVSKKDKNAFYAKRLKRYVSIVNKLVLHEEMSLKNMQDIGGCRAVVGNEKKLRQSIRELKRLSNFRFENGKYKYKDYVKNPKDSGYRGFHLIGKFPDQDNNLKSIEVQIRTRIQHYWATTVEIVDLFTDQALKSKQGEQIWKEFFIYTSHQFSVMERGHLFEGLDKQSKREIYDALLIRNPELNDSRIKAKKISKTLKVVKKLEAFSNSLKIIGERLDSEEAYTGYVLLTIDTEEKTVFSTLFPAQDSKNAEHAYTAAEKASTSKEVVALVSSGAIDNLKEAYPNYFADSSKFVELLKLICQ